MFDEHEIIIIHDSRLTIQKKSFNFYTLNMFSCRLHFYALNKNIFISSTKIKYPLNVMLSTPTAVTTTRHCTAEALTWRRTHFSCSSYTIKVHRQSNHKKTRRIINRSHTKLLLYNHLWHFISTVLSVYEMTRVHLWPNYDESVSRNCCEKYYQKTL